VAASTRHVMRSILLLVGLFAAALMGADVAAQSPAPRSDLPMFRVGDAVRVTVWGSPELSGQFEIGEDGTVIHPLYRVIPIAGMTHVQAEREFRRVLQRFETDPELVVEPLFRVSVGGEVRAPNIYMVTPYTTVVQAVTQAGGPTENAQLRRLRLLRDGGELHVDLTQPHGELTDLRLRSGDQIIVDTRRSIWRDNIEPTLRTVGAVSSIIYVVLRVSNLLN
jgi:protein involved in polysaccharide export with SLBB domain